MGVFTPMTTSFALVVHGPWVEPTDRIAASLDLCYGARDPRIPAKAGA